MYKIKKAEETEKEQATIGITTKKPVYAFDEADRLVEINQEENLNKNSKTKSI